MAEPTNEQKQRFMARAAEFAKTHPDFAEKHAQAQARAAAGQVDLPLAVAHEIVRLGSPEAYYTILTDPREAVSFHVGQSQYSNPDRDADKVRRLHSRIQRNQTFQAVGEIDGEQRKVAEYLEKRREDFRSGKRRRR